MKEILKGFDSKTITSVGGVFIAALLAYFLWDLAGGKLDAVKDAVADHGSEDSRSKEKLADALLQNAKALEGNTKVLEQVIKQR